MFPTLKRKPSPHIFYWHVQVRGRFRGWASNLKRYATGALALALTLTTTPAFDEGPATLADDLAERSRTIQYLEYVMKKCLTSDTFQLHDGAVYRCKTELIVPASAVPYGAAH